MKKEQDIKIGQRIKHIRSELGLNQKEFANKIDATVSALSNWENGRNKPNDIMLNNISKLGNITVDELLHGEKYTPERIQQMHEKNPTEFKRGVIEQIIFLLNNLDDHIHMLKPREITFFMKLLSYHENIGVFSQEEIFTHIANNAYETFENHWNIKKNYLGGEMLAAFLNGKSSGVSFVFGTLLMEFEIFSSKSSGPLKFLITSSVEELKSNFNHWSVLRLPGAIPRDYLDENNILKPEYQDNLTNAISYQQYMELMNKLNDVKTFIDKMDF
ncbi:helix-turn-helix transcriptional regulator [Dolosigranulum savutiense]|uniref:Helix-turn-helix transcriptional regulator n=1 Tax=Dolosigranulum savutiense TaxID=3110288 RepID=A0AB74U0D6_9LACT